MSFDINEFTEKYPFLSIGRYAKNEYIGIIQNASKTIVSMYDFTAIKDPELKKLFLQLGDEYWWSSNRQISIDIFLKGEFDVFRPYIVSFNAKEFELVKGPSVSIGSLSRKRVKRKTIQLIRN